MSPSNLFPIKFWKFLAVSFGSGYYDSKTIKNDSKIFKSPCSESHELRVWVK